MRVLIAGVLAGILYFAWGAFAHMVLPIGEMGSRAPADEDAALTALTTALGSEEGIYYLPYIDKAGMQNPAATSTFSAKSAASPYAYIIWQPTPTGEDPMDMVRELGQQAIGDIVLGVLLAWVLSLISAGFASRVGASIAVGIVVTLATLVPYWNWYRFPTAWLQGQMIESIVGFLLAGIVAAWWLGRAKVRRYQRL